MLKEIVSRFNHLSTYNSVESICSKMNAEFHACFYNNKGAVYASYTDEGGKAKVQKLSN